MTQSTEQGELATAVTAIMGSLGIDDGYVVTGADKPVASRVVASMAGEQAAG